MSRFIQSPKTLEDFVSNVRFQLENVEGWLMMQRDRGGDLDCVHIKSECLNQASAALVAAVEAEMRKAGK